MIKAYPVIGKRKSVDICKAFIEGAPKDATGSVYYGLNETNHKARAEAPFYYIDNSYFDCVRGQQYRVTRNAQQCHPTSLFSTGERFAALGITLKPWQPRHDGFWLVVEQSPSFMTVVARDPLWFESTIARLAAEGRDVKPRPWARDKLKQQATLLAELAGASTLVTHSSAAAVTAAIEGVPIIVSSASALYRMRWSTDPQHDQRQAFLNVLADNQWTLDEIRAGKAWSWLQQK